MLFKALMRASKLTKIAAPRRVLTARYMNSNSSSFINVSTSTYLENIYQQYLIDPNSVHISWKLYFDGKLADNINPLPPTASPTAHAHAADSHDNGSQVMAHMKVQLLVRAYQVRGHILANLDPLNITNKTKPVPECDYRTYGFTEADLDRKFYLGEGILPRFASGVNAPITLRSIIQHLEATYCGHIGIEYGHINDRASCEWLRTKFEVPVKYKYSKEKKLVILDRLMWSDSFERFVSSKYPSEKRFGLEGCESLIPGMKSMIDTSVSLGVSSVVMGMPHRGRLNVLSNVVRKSNESIFSEFTGSLDNVVEGSGDVKYHLGMNYIRPTPSGKMVHLSLVANPSHLEAVNPVVQGKVRGIQFYQNDEAERGKALGVLLHGDAAFAGQGIVYESLGLTDLPAYTTGGTIHIIVNNQIGFTTDPRFSRSTPYCSDVAKTVSAPILHVNADDTEAVVFCMELASEWRARYKTDIVVDLVCYRKYGHNEIDQPGFTQPLMYQKISKMKPVLQKYIDQLLSEGEITKEEIEGMKSRIWAILEQNYEDSKTYQDNSLEWTSSNWPGFKAPSELAQEVVKTQPTGVDTDIIKHIGSVLGSYPSKEETGFVVHPNLGKILKSRVESVQQGQGIDWSTAEGLAFGTLLSEGNHVRLSGQDVERGTFSQRHSVLHDQKTDRKYVPLNNLVKGDLIPSQAKFSVSNSSLSEYGILGFELGYSLVNPNQLVIWEAQFGDFANTAQCIIDQFICCGEQKWLQRTGLTVLLPHGYDGQGPEHSSGRIERFLQLTDEDPYHMPDVDKTGKDSYCRQHQDINMAVVYPTTPANYFHVLRRQVLRDFRKPLIVFNSKALFRHPLAKSSITEMSHDTRFQRMIPEVLHPSPLTDLVILQNSEDFSWQKNNQEPRMPYALVTDPAYPIQNPHEPAAVVVPDAFTLLPPSQIKTLIFCSGQVYYLLYRARALNMLKHIAIVRVEQLCPFPFWEIQRTIDFYQEGLEEIVWCQEESFNSGAWAHVEPRLETALRETKWLKSDKGKAWQVKLDSERVAGGIENRRIKERPMKSFRGGKTVRYAGRDQSAAPSTGIKKQHKAEEYSLISEAFYNGELKKVEEYVQGVPRFIV